MKAIKRNRLLASAVAALLALAAAPAGADLFRAPVADWTGGAVTCEIIHQILEREMGHKVKRITMPSGPAVSEGLRAGDLDYACETWPSYSTTRRSTSPSSEETARSATTLRSA